MRTLLQYFASRENYLFEPRDFSLLFTELSPEAQKMLLVRAVGEGLLIRVCRGVYLYPNVPWPRGLLLYHTAARLRANHLVYLSLESVLSDAGVISQVPIQWIACMTSGRSGVISCGAYGTIEFVHTKKTAQQVAPYLTFDAECRLWRANVPLALQDLRATKRSMDLVDWEAAHEFI